MMFLPLIVRHATSATNPLSGFLNGYWQGLVGFILGIASLVVADLFLDWYRKRRDRPRLSFEPESLSYKNGVTFGVVVKNYGRTPLLEMTNRVFVMAPQLAIDGKLARLLPHNYLMTACPWYDTKGYLSEPQDLWPMPFGSFSLWFGSANRAGDDAWIELLNAGKFETPDLRGNPKDMTFSESYKEAKPMTTLKLAIMVLVVGKTHYGGVVQDRLLCLAEVPDFTSLGGCDFSKARLTFLKRGLKGNLRPLLERLGFDQGDAASEPIPPFPQKET